MNGIKKAIEDVAHELKSIKNVLNSMWYDNHPDKTSSSLCPDAYADEYISTEECGRRLNISDQTIRNWIALGRSKPDAGWKEGVHYINIVPDGQRKAIIRIPWNQVIQSFIKNKKIESSDLYKKKPLYKTSHKDLI
tara:strand:- start:953 stop:1360 length:408 start_codon:yes stop_codon:yes gene_type:complete